MSGENSKKDFEQIGLIGSEGSAVPLVGLAYQGKLRGLAVELFIRQRYRNNGPNPVETVYTFPVPDGAAVCGLTITSEDRVLIAEIDEREEAFARYYDALAESDGAVLLDQERENVLHLSVGSILPGKECVVELRLIYEVSVEGKGVRLLLPTIVSPRYTPLATRPEERAELERITPPYVKSVPYGLTFEVDADPGYRVTSVSSPSHALQTTFEDGRVKVINAQRDEIPNRDIVLAFETAEGFNSSAMASPFHGQDHVLVSLMPEMAEVTPAAAQSEGRDLAFMIDCSGSMDGSSIDEARRAVELCLRAMSAGDRFHIIRFGDRAEALFEEFRILSQETLDETAREIRSINADLGGTEMLTALKELIAASESSRRLDVILLTDGQVSDEAKITAFAKKNAARWRFFTFGIGTAVNEALVRKLAAVTGGKSEFITPGERVEPKVLRQFGRISTAVMEGVTIDWGAGKVVTAPVELPPIFPGEPFAVAALFEEEVPDGHPVKIRGKTSDGELRWEIPVRRVQGDAVPLLWAKKRIADLETDSGASSRKRAKKQAEECLIELSKKYGILCSMTSFVAVEQRAEADKTDRPPEMRRIPVMINDGWHGIHTGRTCASSMSIGSIFCSEPLLGSARAPLPSPIRAKAAFQCDLLADIDAASFVEKAAPIHLRLMLIQKLDGSFALDEILLEAAGMSVDEFKKYAGELGQSEEMVSTALAIAVLQAVAAEHAEECSRAVEKAVEWLKNKLSQVSFTELVAHLSLRIKASGRRGFMAS